MRAAESAAPSSHPSVLNSQIATIYLAVFEAVNASTGSKWNTYSGASLPTDARADLAASYAAYASLSAIYGGSTSAFNARLATLTTGATEEEIATAQAVGTQAYNAVSSSRSSGTDTFFTKRIGQFLPAPPPTIDSQEFAENYNQVKQLGGVHSAVRTPEQTEIASFWLDNRTELMTTLAWNAETILAGQGLVGAEFVRSMALFAGGMHDALLEVSASKAHYKTDRPITAIHNGDTDDNALTEGDVSWLMFGNNTPPEDLSYSYASGGGTMGGYFANMLGRLIESDTVSFEFRYPGRAGTRGFEQLSVMSTEFGLSRIYNGEHFLHDVEAGWLMSELIVEYIYANALTPVNL